MRVFKTRVFKRWADAEGLADTALCQAMCEIEQGLYEASLGSGLIKKRVPLPGRGKRGGGRTLLAYQVGQRAVFVLGFSKNDRESVTDSELKSLRVYAREFLALTEVAILIAANRSALHEVTCP